MLLRLFSFATSIFLALGFVQEITFYTEPNAGGDGFLFRSKQPDLSPHYSSQLRMVRSYCYTGWWIGFNETNYSNQNTLNQDSANGTVVCRNATFPLTMSLRYQGPLDTTTPSVSIYSGTISNYAGGIERTFTALAATNFGFVPKYMVLTGRSSWTGFFNDDFTGNSTCFSTSELVAQVYLTEITVRSLVKGCDAKYESEYYDVDKIL
ncbi:uncharacterized protein LOC110855149 [Folsomia candida]|nr:uncharacterized protein LOC110855149 [Folsomia candida]